MPFDLLYEFSKLRLAQGGKNDFGPPMFRTRLCTNPVLSRIIYVLWSGSTVTVGAVKASLKWMMTLKSMLQKKSCNLTTDSKPNTCGSDDKVIIIYYAR